MTMLYIFVLMSALICTFAQTVQQKAQPRNAPKYSAPVSVTPSSDAIKAFSQIKETNLNSPFSQIFVNFPASGPSNRDKNDKSDGPLRQTDPNFSLPNNAYQSPKSASNKNNPDSQLENTDLNPPNLSEFAKYSLQVQEYANIYPRLYDVSFSPNDVREIFYNEVVYFALENGIYKVGSLPSQLADAVEHVLPKLTPLEYFKAISNTLELSLKRGGIATEKNYQVLARLNAKDLKDATDYLKVNDAKSALHAIVVGAETFFKSLNLNSPDVIKFIITNLIEQFSKVPSIRTV